LGDQLRVGASDRVGELAGVQVLWRSGILQLSECLSGRYAVSAVVGLVRAVLATAVVGGVGRPVSGGGALPGDCDADVDAEQPREQGGGEFGGETEQRGRASLARRDPQFAETVREVGSAEGPAGPSAGEAPLGRSLVAEGGVSGAGCDQLSDEGGQRLGKDDGFAAEPEPYFSLVENVNPSPTTLVNPSPTTL